MEQTNQTRLTALKHLAQYPQWVMWRLEAKPGETKPTKVPYYIKDGKPAMADKTDPLQWMTYTEAVEGARRFNMSGVGFCTSKTYGPKFVWIDLDHCIDENGNLSDFAKKTVREINSYTEKTPSGRGLRIVALAETPEGKQANMVKNIQDPDNPAVKVKLFELYSDVSYLTVTGDHLEGTSPYIEERQAEVTEFYNRYYEDKPRGERLAAIPATTQRDEEIKQRMEQEAAVNEKFKDLYEGRVEKHFINPDGKPDHSSADQSFCNTLARLFDGDAGAIDRGMQLSELYRDKWERVSRGEQDYKTRTISRALESYRKYRNELQASTPPQLEAAQGQTGWTPDQMLQAVERYLNLNERGDGNLFIELFRNHFVYDHAKKRWYRWAGNYWVEDKTDHIISSVDALVKFYTKALNLSVSKRLKERKSTVEKTTPHIDKHEKLEKSILGRIKDLGTVFRREHIIKMARSGDHSLGITGDEWDADTMLLGCKNGVVDLRTGTFRPGKQEDYIRTVLPIDYDPEATCPTWERYLNDIFDFDPDIIDYLQRRCGYSLTGDVSEQDVVFMTGERRNGKSTFLETINKLLGPLAHEATASVIIAASRPQTSNAPTPEIMALRGKRFVWIDETLEGDTVNAARLKMLTGGGWTSGRGMHENQTNFELTQKIWIATNDLPRIEHTDEAAWARVFVIPFKYRFVDNPKGDNEKPRDKGMKKKLSKERQGILNWMIQGCLEWQRLEGLEPPERIMVATQNYRDTYDDIKDFINEALEDIRPNDDGDRTTLVYLAYQTWCRNNGIRYPLKEKKFRDRFKKHGFISRKSDGYPIYEGLKVKSEHLPQSSTNTPF